MAILPSENLDPNAPPVGGVEGSLVKAPFWYLLRYKETKEIIEVHDHVLYIELCIYLLLDLMIDAFIDSFLSINASASLSCILCHDHLHVNQCIYNIYPT